MEHMCKNPVDVFDFNKHCDVVLFGQILITRAATS